MKLRVSKAILIGSMVLVLAVAVAGAYFAGRDTGKAQERRDAASLQATQVSLTQAAIPPTPTATPNPAVVLNRFCTVVREFFIAHREGVRFQNAAISAGERLTAASLETREQFASLVRGAEIVTIPVPPQGTSPEAMRLYEAIRALKQARAELVTVVRASDHSGFNPANDQANVHARDVVELFRFVCPSYQVLPP